MDWNKETHAAITLARLKFADPEMVYAELREYSDHFHARAIHYPVEELENALLARNDPLINLGLAQYGKSESVVVTLYKCGLVGSGDAAYDKGLRLACLSNQIDPLSYGARSFVEKDPTELRRLAHQGDWDEIAVLMGNPSARSILDSLYNRQSPFDKISDDRCCELVHATIGNPGINTDMGSGSGPDSARWRIHEGIYNLLRTAPIDPKWASCLGELLLKVDPSLVHCPKSDPREVFKRWSELDDDSEGWATSLSFTEEFRCQIAALYGSKWEDHRSKEVGNPDDADMVIRCAYYGRANMTPLQMKAGHQRDKEVFVFAALSNNNLLDNKECRTELENIISGRRLWHTYVSRCNQFHKHWPNFDSGPITERGATLVDHINEKVLSDEMTALSKIEVKVAALQKQISDIFTILPWAFGILLVILILFRN